MGTGMDTDDRMMEEERRRRRPRPPVLLLDESSDTTENACTANRGRSFPLSACTCFLIKLGSRLKLRRSSELDRASCDA